MNHAKHAGRSLLRHLGVAVAAAIPVAACTTRQVPGELVATTSSAIFANGGFETGAAGAPPPSWTVQPYLNDGITVQTPQTRAGLDLAAGGKPLTTTIAGVDQPDPDLGVAASLRWPKFGAQCALVNFHSSTTYGNGQNVNSLSQIMTIGAGDVDPSDGQVHVRFVVAPVLQNPVHAPNQQPYYLVQLTDVTQNALLYSDFNLSGQPGIPWKTVNGGTANEIDYTDWQVVDISPVGGTLAMGDMVKLEIIASGCSLGGHFGEIYVDGSPSGPVLPGLFVSGSGPSQANACSNITYKLAYQNGDVVAATGVTVAFNTPPNTTYQSINAPGLTCVTPAVGMAGLVTCTVGDLAAGATGSFTVTVNIGCAATGTIVAGNYFIQGTGIELLLGSHVLTTIGCTLDSQCAAGQWCNESASACTATLANGAAIPTDTAHTNPTLTGVCSAQAGALVCTSQVCDSADNECGYATGDGPCTTMNGATVCRSGACSANGTCEPAGGCNVDADCGTGNWCNNLAGAGACQPKVINGQPVPGGSCVTAVALRACVSAVCIASGALAGTCEACASDVNCAAPAPVCSLASATCVQCTTAEMGACTGATPVCDPTKLTCAACNGDNGSTATLACPTTADPYCAAAGTCGKCASNADCATGHAGTICGTTTGACGTTCAVDTDCPMADWCTAAGVCTPKTANGQPVPTPAPINGTCTMAIGARVCMSGVCDTADNKCGYASGDGNCTAADAGADAGTGAAVCRSLSCASTGPSSGKCACLVDTDCSGTTPACDAASGTCVQCTAANETACTAGTPTCDVVGQVCVAAASDAGADVASQGGVDAQSVDANDAAMVGNDASDAAVVDASDAEATNANDAQVADASDAAAAEDTGTVEPPPSTTGGTIEGGGLSCSMSRAPTAPGGGLLALPLVLFAGLLGSARRARRSNHRAN
jgi:hypothetical protein